MAWSSEQVSNAQTIISVGQQLGASQRDIQIAIMTALQESGLRNLNYGDRDSIGMFQQRNAWGSNADRLDPVKSARMFFTGGGQGQRGLLDFKQRNSWSLTKAAQKVQVSAFPDAYAKWEKDALGLLGQTGGGVSVTTPDSDLQPPLGDFAPSEVGQGTPGLQAYQIDTKGMPIGVSSAMAPGIESGDKMPVFEVGAGAPGFDLPALDAQSFSQQFPQGTPANGRRDLAIRTAKSFLGTPYRFGGNDDRGIDCSGLLQQALKPAGINLPRISFQQANYGKRVGLGQLKPGDLVAMDNSSRNYGADHIAMWLGNGQIIEAPRTGLTVRIRNIDDDEGWYGVALDY